MDVTVTGRHCSVTEEFRTHVEERAHRLARHREGVSAVEVVCTTGPARQPDDAVKVEITVRSRGPVLRAEATAADRMVAFEHALERLTSQARRAADRAKHRYHSHPRGQRLEQQQRRHENLRAAALREVAEEVHAAGADSQGPGHSVVAGVEVTGEGPLSIREKEFVAAPMTVCQALEQMELVGHDFFLFSDADTGRPAVVYRRHGYDFGVIRLDTQAGVADATDSVDRAAG